MATLECRSAQQGVESKWVTIDNITDQQVREARQRLDGLLASMSSPSDAVAMAFLAVARECPRANPSDLWHHVIYRHLLALGWSDNKWKRVSGFALERAFVTLYSDRLLAHDLRIRILSAPAANKFLHTLGTDITASKVDIFVEGLVDEDEDEWMVFGAVHVKSSIAERIQDDVPASRTIISRISW